MKPRRGTEAARATRHAAGWDRTNAAMPQWVGKDDIDVEYAQALFEHNWSANKNEQDKIAQKNGKHLERSKQAVRSQIAEAWKKLPKYRKQKQKNTFSMLQLFARQWNVRVTPAEHRPNGTTGTTTAGPKELQAMLKVASDQI